MTKGGGHPPRMHRLYRWLKRIGLVFLGLLALLILFHRPLIFEGTRYFVVRAAKQQNLDIDYDIGGSIFSTLTVSNLKATPTEPGPIQRLEIGNIDLRYSLWDAIRNGLPALLELVQVQDVYIELTPSEEPPPEKQEEPQEFKFPALFPKTLQLENINFLSHGRDGDTVLEGLWFTLLPDKPGVLKVQTLDIPGVHRWSEIRGDTTFRDRNLLLTNLDIGGEIALERFNLDASQLDEQQLGIALEGRIFDAAIDLHIRIDNLNKTNDLTARLLLEGLVLQRVWDYLNLEIPCTGTLNLVAADFSGRPDEPATWNGTVGLRAKALATDVQPIGDVLLGISMENASAHLDLLATLDAQNKAAVLAAASLPETLEVFAETPVEGSLALRLGDLSAATATMANPITGSGAGVIEFRLADGIAFASGQIRGERLASTGAEISAFALQLEASRRLQTEEGAPPLADTSAELTLGATNVRYEDYAIDSAGFALTLQETNVSLRLLNVRRGSNHITVSGECTLPEDLQSFENFPWNATIDVQTPRLEEFLAEGSALDLRGALQIQGSAEANAADIRGSFDITGRDIVINGLEVPTIDGNVRVADNAAQLPSLRIAFNEDNGITASGRVQLSEPFAYEGSLAVNLTDLSIFDPFSPQSLAGSLSIAWSGSGNVREMQHSGSGNLTLTNGQFGDQTELEARIEANYTPDRIDVPVLQAKAEMGGLAATLHWSNNQLAIRDLVGRLQDLTVFTGSATLPLDLTHYDDPEQLLPSDGAVDIALEVPQIHLPQILERLGQDEAPVSGTVRATVAAHGTIDELTASLSVVANNLKAVAAADVQPADVSLNLTLANDRLTADGRITQPRINPLIISGGIPFDLAEIRRTQKIPPDTPLDLDIRMVDSSLGFVASLVPAIRYLQGTAGVDISVSGTVANPRLSGTVDADIKNLSLHNEGLPPITNVVVRIDSTTERLTVSQFRGEMGGGVFGAEGSVDFSNIERPVFDLAFGTRNALVFQDEAITLRISSRIDLDGPIDAATVSGDVFVTRSRFYKDIDILPIGLPGRPAPQPPEAPQAPGISRPPLRDWKFDIDVQTADPFLVQGNLANGRIVVDLHIGGTGMNPWVDGSVHLEQLRTSLPFSTLEIDNGLVYFTRDRPFLPQFDIRGTSQIRDYDITAYVYGTMSDPKAEFTSNPPLPQTEIVTLIATGVTSEELAGNPSVIAGKAATILFQKIYRSIFKSKEHGPQQETLLSRLDFELGTTDPRTGRQGIGMRYPLTDNIILTSGVDVGGDFRGQVKYLIRFR